MAIHNLSQLLKEMSPLLNKEPLVMVTTSSDLAQELLPDAIAMVKEHEGVTLVLHAERAREYDFGITNTFNLISLRVESDLLAVGLTAAFASALSAEGIPTNVLAGFYHDHILVPEEMAEQAMAVLNNLSGSAQ